MASAATIPVAPSRQKNCHSCVQAKRRCDRRQPVCGRCSQRQITCTFEAARGPKVTRRGEPRVPQSTTPPYSDRGASTPIPAFAPDTSFSASAEFGAEFVQGAVASRYQDPMESLIDVSDVAALGDDLFFDGQFDMPIPDALSAAMSTPDQDLVLMNPQITFERPGSPAGEDVMQSFENMGDFCDDITPWQLSDENSTLHAIVSRVTTFPAIFATSKSTAFLHPYLYRHNHLTPPCITTCLSDAILFTNRTPATASMVLRTLYGNISNLVAAGEAAFTPVEKLARVQALLLYQVMRLFDGDIALRVQGERDLVVLKRWVGELCKVREDAGKLEGIGDGSRHPMKEWTKWIFEESVRRTIVMAYSVMGLYDELRRVETPLAWVVVDSRADHQDPFTFKHRWTLSRHLWEAGSPLEFERAWKEKPHFAMVNYSFEQFMKHGRSESVDEFGELLLIAYLGKDGLDEFMSTGADKR